MIGVLQGMSAHGAEFVKIGLVCCQQGKMSRGAADDCDRAGTGDIDQIGGVVHLMFVRCFRKQVFAAAGSECFLVGKRASEVKSLNFSAADLPKELQLFLVFDALGEGVHTERLCHGHNAGDDLAALGIEVPEKFHVNLEFVEGKIVQSVQGGVIAPEIIEPYLISCVVKFLNDGFQGLALPHHDRFGDLDMEKVSGKMVCRNGALENLQRIHQIEVKLGEVDGHRNDGKPACQALVHEPSAFPDDMGVQTVNQARFFQNRDKDIGAQKSPLRIFPARQSFKTAELPGECADNRLIVDTNITVLQGIVDVLDDKEPVLHPFSHIVGVDGAGFRDICLYGQGGNFGPVKGIYQPCVVRVLRRV